MPRGQASEDHTRLELERRLEQATAGAARLLGCNAKSRDAVPLSELIAATEARLAELDSSTEWREAVVAHTAELDNLRQRRQTRVDALAHAEQAVAVLREITAPAGILGRAPKELCEHSRLERAILSVISRGLIIAEAAHFRDDPVGTLKVIEDLRRQPPRLEHPLIETDIVRRRRATIVTDAHSHPRVHRPTTHTMGWQAYVAAPIVVRGKVIGVIHADRGANGRPLDVLDGDVLWTFARGLADAYETASLRRSLRQQRDRMRQFVDWLAARSIELSDTSMQLVTKPTPPPQPPGKPDIIPASPHVDDRLVFHDLLSRRELEVLRLLSRGETNGSIASQLVISEATVKFHVVNLMRKLHVTNRAQAVSRYHHLVRLERGGA